MTTEARPLTLAEISEAVTQAKGKLQVALYGLEIGGTDPERDMITGYAGATAQKHLREAAREIDKAITQLDTVKR